MEAIRLRYCGGVGRREGVGQATQLTHLCFFPPQLPSLGRQNESETLGAHVRSRFKVDHDAEGYRVKALYICGYRLAYKIRHRLTSAEKGSLWIRDGSDP